MFLNPKQTYLGSQAGGSTGVPESGGVLYFSVSGGIWRTPLTSWNPVPHIITEGYTGYYGFVLGPGSLVAITNAGSSNSLLLKDASDAADENLVVANEGFIVIGGWDPVEERYIGRVSSDNIDAISLLGAETSLFATGGGTGGDVNNIVLDLENRLMFIADASNSEAIHVANLSSPYDKTSILTPAWKPFKLALSDDYVFAENLTGPDIVRMDRDGGNLTTIKSSSGQGGTEGRGLATWENKLYYPSNRTLRRMDFDGMNDEEVFPLFYSVHIAIK